MGDAEPAETPGDGEMHVLKTLPLTVAAVAVLGTVAGAMDPSMLDREQSYRGTPYVCTGIGLGSRENTAWNAYPLKLMFATKEGDYLADVSVSLWDSEGKLVLEAECPSPWLLVDLHPGKYRVTAVVTGAQPRTANINVAGGRQTAVVIQYPDIDET